MANTKFTICFILSTFCSYAFATAVSKRGSSLNDLSIANVVESSPGPREPLLEEGMYIFRAGRDPSLIMPLRDGMTVCIKPDHYPMGITIRCVGQSTARVARFWVNGVRTQTERRQPFYLFGDKNGRVKPWRQPILRESMKALIRCKVSKPFRNFRATVTFKC